MVDVCNQEKRGFETKYVATDALLMLLRHDPEPEVLAWVKEELTGEEIEELQHAATRLAGLCVRIQMDGIIR